jgi:hypothetical protein
MSEIKVNKISPRTNCGTVQLGDSGDTITIPAGATITNNGTAAGFGATGAASWDTTVKTASFTGVAGVGYFVNTTSGAITVTLPASPDAGAVVAVSDYAQNAETNNITLARNGSNIQGDAEDLVLQRNGIAMTLVFVDATKGWIVTDTGAEADKEPDPGFVTATGGTITECGNFKIHTFTGPGTFTVSCAGNPLGSETVDYLVVAGGGSGGGRYGGGGGGGGYRESSGAASGCYSISPLGACVSALPVTVQGYPITVGGGGTGVPAVPGSDDGNRGNNSIFSTITSTGGGAGAGQNAVSPLGPGGSGGGGSYGSTCGNQLGGTGNTPPVSPPQGQPGGLGYQPNSPYSTGGGGGATEAGVNANSSPSAAGRGGAGATSSITGSPVGRSGGGGGSGEGSHGVTAGGASPCGSGTAGSSSNTPAGAGADNRGGGGGAAYYPGPSSSSGNGGSGVVIIRYKFQ